MWYLWLNPVFTVNKSSHSHSFIDFCLTWHCYPPRLLRMYWPYHMTFSRNQSPVTRWWWTEAMSLKLHAALHLDFMPSHSDGNGVSTLTWIHYKGPGKSIPFNCGIKDVCQAPLYFFTNRDHILSRVADKHLSQTPLQLWMGMWPSSSQ